MDTSVITICLVLVGIIFIPFFLFNMSGKSTSKKVEEAAKALNTKNQLTISQSELWGNAYIGIDENKQKLVFLKFSEKETYERVVAISSVKDCMILEQRKFFKVKNKKDSHLEKLDLKITLKSGQYFELNFYDETLNYSEDFEVKRIEKWKMLINQLITLESNVKQVA
ncbi:hypothetical protein I2486_11205 [Cellulophaga sp. E16_2]|uniref:Uncharacterized protein n=1 Tax=Cellulophaga algicola (strain DSM 14237 / IC166 / ACAM 630) TaxID=688270 RepID=E6X5X8_CELAD|nr:MULTISPECIES: hypothetical protein [Cellulophaga]ADV49520.1 hypothetical protein Celal_2226 [Cellulophaga algicola DSM 14237]MBO0591973.1 hypothetical protein [Cellulophaga sp. E16_2]